MKSDWPIIVKVLRRERLLKTLQPSDWDLLIRQANRAQLVGKFCYLAEEEQALSFVQSEIFRHLKSAQIYADKQYRDFLWEVSKLRQVFTDSALPLIFLKGGAYAIAQLSTHKGRLFSDIDLLVPFQSITAVEKRLMVHGWLPEKQNDYDQQYYRRWMHELPPLRHVRRGSVVDLHHNILPRTAAACPDANLFLEAAVDVGGEFAGIKILSPLDRVIHSATHLFYDGELEHGLRDLVDLDGLLAELDAGAKLSLVDRALTLGLQKPVYYALRYLQIILQTPGLDNAIRQMQNAGCEPKFIRVMDWMFVRALLPDHASCNDTWTGFARWLLYLRSHWLKMPLYLLMPHLSRKAWIRLSGKGQH